MDDRVLQFRVGVVVLAAMLLTATLIVLLGEGDAFIRRTYTLHVELPEAPGVSVDTPVRRDGVRIGRVSEIALLQPQGVLLALEIDADRQLTQGHSAQITSDFPLGNAMVEFVSTNSSTTEPLAHGDRLAGSVNRNNPLEAIEGLETKFNQAADSLTAAASHASGLFNKIETLFDPERGKLAGVLSSSQSALEKFERTAGEIDTVAASIKVAADDFSVVSKNVNQLVTDPKLRKNLDSSINEIPELFAQSRRTLESVEKAMHSFENVTGDFETISTDVKKTLATADATFVEFQSTAKGIQLASQSFQIATSDAQRSMQNVQALTDRLNEDTPEVIDRINRTFEDVEELFEQLAKFSRSLNESDGTLGKLVNDPELYVRLNQAVANVECATRKLGPILDDASVAVDKVARDPGGTIGARSLFDRTPGGLKKVRPAGW